MDATHDTAPVTISIDVATLTAATHRISSVKESLELMSVLAPASVEHRLAALVVQLGDAARLLQPDR